MDTDTTNVTPASASESAPPTGGRSRWLLPHLSDWVFASLLIWLFFGHGAARTLMADGDTGWHIRTGEYVLAKMGIRLTQVAPISCGLGDFLGFCNRVNNHLVSRRIHGYRLLDEPIEEFASAFGVAAVETEGELVQV